MAIPAAYPTLSQDEHGTSLAVLRPSQADMLARIQAVKDVIARGCTNAELDVFAEVCRHTGLNPFTRQIYAIKTSAGMGIIVGIDGFRAKAEDSGKYRGQRGPFWCAEDGEWRDVWLSAKAPVACKVAVIRSDFDEPIWAVARTEAYRMATNPQWTKMPEVMVAKCAEALAIRKAFPGELSGVYAPEEMEQATATNDTALATAAPQARNQGDGRRVVEAGKPARTLAQTQPAAPVVHVNEDTGEVTRAAPAAEKPAPKESANKPNWGKARLAMQDIGIKTQHDAEQFIADVLHIGLVAASDLRQLSMSDYDAVMQAIENRLVDTALAADAASSAQDSGEQQPQAAIEHDLSTLPMAGGAPLN